MTGPESKELGPCLQYLQGWGLMCLPVCAPQPRAAGRRQGNGTLESESAGGGFTEIHGSSAHSVGCAGPRCSLRASSLKREKKKDIAGT